MIKHKCRGVRLTGTWRGYPCGASGKVQHLGQWFCANHILVRTTAPEKFQEAIAARKRWEKKQDDEWVQVVASLKKPQ